jgi:hypothetical protein
MKLSLAVVTVLATFALALPQQKGGQGKGQGNNANAADNAPNAKANDGADVSLLDQYKMRRLEWFEAEANP